jgi:hypothetical protein
MERESKRAGANHFTSKTRKRAAVVAMTGAAVAAGLVLAVPAGASPLAARPAAVSGTGHFQIMSTSGAGAANTAGVIAWGAFINHGIDHENNSNARTSTDLFTFAGGSFKVTHTTKSMSQTVNAKACFYIFSEKGTYKLSGGTGKYKGISGSGTFTGTGLGFGPKTKSGACNENANPIDFQMVIDGTGAVKIP